MLLSPNLIGERAADPHRAQTQHEMRRDVPHSQRVLAVAPKVHGFVAKGRESCEPAEDADEDKGARFRGEDAARLSQL
jgi:hypothetical protein